MRILDETSDRALKRVSLFLTPEEAKSVAGQLEGLISKPGLHHIHIEDEGFEREITIAIYTQSNISKFDRRSRLLIEDDK